MALMFHEMSQNFKIMKVSYYQILIIFFTIMLV